MSKKTLALILLLAVIAGILLYVAFSTTRGQPQPAQEGITPTPQVQGDSVLSLAPNPLNLSSPSGTVNVNIDSGSDTVSAVQVELSYNPSLLQNLQVQPGTFFTNPNILLQEVNSDTGRISFAIADELTSNGKTGTGTVAVITFTASALDQNGSSTAGTQTRIDFQPKSIVTSPGTSGQSVLKESSGTTIIFPESGFQVVPPVGTQGATLQ